MGFLIASDGKTAWNVSQVRRAVLKDFQDGAKVFQLEMVDGRWLTPIFYTRPDEVISDIRDYIDILGEALGEFGVVRVEEVSE